MGEITGFSRVTAEFVLTSLLPYVDLASRERSVPGTPPGFEIRACSSRFWKMKSSSRLVLCVARKIFFQDFRLIDFLSETFSGREMLVCRVERANPGLPQTRIVPAIKNAER